MEVRYSPDNLGYKSFSTEQLRKSYLIENLFINGKIQMVYFDLDRAIVGGAVPIESPLQLLSTKREMAADYFAQRREIGIFNIGGVGKIKVDDQEFSVGYKDAVYVGRGAREIFLSSNDKTEPANFYFVSYPAHAVYPTSFIKHGDVYSERLGSRTDANLRTISRYIHPGGVMSSQLVMGLTELDEGSVWNTMPPHTHQRRTEIYFYFNLDKDSVVFHLMGEPSETRHIVVHDKEAVISSSWSIHCGVGTKSYSFIWAMGGENQEFEDMDSVEMNTLK